MAAMPIAQFGSAEQRKRLLPGVAEGDTILTAALSELLNTDPLSPTTTAKDGRLTGTRSLVPAAHLATAVLVPAKAADGIGVFLVDPKGEGVTLERQVATTGEPVWTMELQNAPGEQLGGEEVLHRILELTTAGLCMVALGVCEQALKMTAEYTSQREQFERPLAAFQAVAQRAADAYIDTEGIRLTAWQAIWRLAEGMPAANELAVAKFWAAEGGQRVVHAAQHLHGGIGVDVDYPLHRYFLWAKECELTLGSATPQLVQLGKALADEPV
jgi:alkylation response protein AidB-like acyl-CoA dehydrogenase